jgi:hypothetical protein
MTTPMSPATAEDLRAEQAKEYGQWVATSVIYVGNARAFNVGDPVPASHVTSGAVSREQVSKPGTKAADAATTTTEKG